jgi:phage shock protein PspC (stress-responsive transcriptional regulator)
VRIAVGAVVFLGVAVAVLLNRIGDVPPSNAMIMGSAAMVAGVLIGTPIVLLLWIVRGKTRGGQRRLYQRLGPGRMISGVCLGIAEATRVDVNVIRIAFVVLLLADGVGFWLYVLLALTMAVHPDDRQYLLRFRLRRWWQRRFADAENHAR